MSLCPQPLSPAWRASYQYQYQCIHVYMYICINVFAYFCNCAYVYVYMRIYILYVYAYINICACVHICIYVRMYPCIYVYRRLGGVSSPLGRPPRNREIVSCRACVRAEPMLGGNASQISSVPSFPFPFVPGGPSLFPCEIRCSLSLEINEKS
jgi:hypothetical protein